MCKIIQIQVHPGYNKSIKERVVVSTQGSLGRGSAEDVMLQLNVGLYKGFPGRLERASYNRHLCTKPFLLRSSLARARGVCGLKTGSEPGDQKGLCMEWWATLCLPGEALGFETYPLGTGSHGRV